MEKVQIIAKFEEIIASIGFLLIDVNFRGDNRLRIVEIYIDNDKGITTDDCSKVSRVLNEAIEKENLIDTNYRLDVSSPGTDRPLKYLVQYEKHLNRKFDIEYKYEDEIKKSTLKLISINGNDLYFEEKENQIKINYKDIIKAKVVISF